MYNTFALKYFRGESCEQLFDVNKFVLRYLVAANRFNPCSTCTSNALTGGAPVWGGLGYFRRFIGDRFSIYKDRGISTVVGRDL